MVTDVIGVLAGFFVILSFYTTHPFQLRVFAIISNILFITFGASAGVMPVFVLHAILLPLNAARLLQLTQRNRNDSWRLGRYGLRKIQR